MRTRRNDYKSIEPDPQTVRDEINRNRIVENHHFADASVFKKTPDEKLKLKNAKLRNRRWLRQQSKSRKKFIN
jgi:hypothetical protein